MRARWISISALATGMTVAGCVVEAPPDTGSESAAASVEQWTDDVQIAGMSSPYQVGLAAHANRLHMIFTGNDSRVYATEFIGNGWSAAKSTGLHADYGPALVDYNGKLTTVYHSHGQNRLLMSTSTDGNTWSTPVTAGSPLVDHTLDYAPSLTVFGGQLYAAYCVAAGNTERVEIDRYDGTQWDLRKVYMIPFDADHGNICKHTAMTVRPDGRLDLLFTWERGSEWTMQEAFARSATDWDNYPTGNLQMKSKKPPSMVTCGGITHMVHGGFSNPLEIWWSMLDVTDTWTTNVRVPDQASDGGAALGCHGNSRTIMVHNGGYTQLWWSEFGP